MLLQLEDQPLNRFSAPDLYAFPQGAQMAATVHSWIASLEFGEKLDSGLIGMIFQPLSHLRPMSSAAVRNGGPSSRLIAEAAVLSWRDDDASSTRILTPLFHALRETIYMLRMKASWELDA
jgi:hypothetical protein